MTTIAWDGKTLASDSQLTIGWGEIDPNPFQKIYSVPDGTFNNEVVTAIGIAGNALKVHEFIDWLKDSKKEKETPSGFEALVVTEKAVYLISEGGYLNINGNTSIGSGSSFARSAMLAGMDAVRSVSHAIKLDCGSGGQIQSITCRK